MAAEAITPKKIDRTTANGILLATFLQLAAADGNYFANNGQQFVVVQNNDEDDSPHTAGPHVLTVEFTGTNDGLSPTNRTYSIAVGETRFIGPFPKDAFNDSDGLVQMTWGDDPVGVSIGVFSLVAE